MANKLPKVSFTDDSMEENGSRMLSRFGKQTTFNYPIFRGVDPLEQHALRMSQLMRRDPDLMASNVQKNLDLDIKLKA
jgi:hypothetical protein